jgi:hypothetical protein
MLSGPMARPRNSIEEEVDLGATLWEGLAHPDRLAEDAKRAARDMQWGVERVEGGPTAFGVEPPPDESTENVVRMWGMLSNARTVVLVAQPIPDQPGLSDKDARHLVTVSVRVGLFGDPGLQEKFLDAYRKRLEGKRARQFGGSFTIPAFSLEKLRKVSLPGLPDASANDSPGPEPSPEAPPDEATPQLE